MTNGTTTNRASERSLRFIQRALHTAFHHNVALKTGVIALELAILWAALATPWTDDAADERMWMTIGLGALAIINFIVFFQADENPDGSLSETRGAAMRRAIAGSVVVTYLLLVAIVAFNPDVQQIAGTDAACLVPEGEEPNATCVALTRDLINRLGIVVIAITGFYFGTSTLEKYLERFRRGQAQGGSELQPPSDPNTTTGSEVSAGDDAGRKETETPTSPRR